MPLFTPARQTRPLALLLGTVCALHLTAMSAHAAPDTAAAADTPRHASISAGPLIDVVNRDAGIALTFDADALRPDVSAGVPGRYRVDAGPRLMLAGTTWRTRAQAATLTSIEVSGQAVHPALTEHSGVYGGSVTTIFKGAQSVRQTPQPVTVVSRQWLDDRTLPDLHEVLQNVPGVTVDYTDSERVNYYSRGYAIDSLQVDGMNLYQAGSNFIQPDTAVLDRIEILRGSAGILRGSGNPSATVNLVRKRPTREFQASADVMAGSWNRRRGQVDLSGAFDEGGRLRGRLIAVADNKDFFQDARYERRKVFYGVLQADLTERTTLTASFSHTELKATGAWGGLPRNPVNGADLGLRRNTYLGADWNRWNRYNQQAMLELEHRFENGWQVMASAVNTRFRYVDGGFKQSYITRAKGAANPYLFDVTTSIYPKSFNDQNGFALNANGPLALFGRTHHLTMGAESSYVRQANASGWFNLGLKTNLDIRAWDPATTYPQPHDTTGGKWYDASNNRTRQQALYALGRFSVADPLTLLVGARATWWHYEVLQTPTQYRVNHEITPYAGIVYDIDENFSAYGSYSEIFAPQQAWDRGGTLLDPIRGEDYEAGIKGAFYEDRLNTALSVFRINNAGQAMDDASSANPCLPNYPRGYCKVASGKTRSEGWELEVSGAITPAWQIMAGYTHTRTRYLRDTAQSNVGQPIRTLDPRHLLRVFTSWRMPGPLRGLTLGAGVQAQSDIHASARGVTARQAGFAVYNALAAYDVNKHLRLQLNLNNLFDKTYYKKVDPVGISNYYGDPRNVMFTLHARM